MSNRSLKHLRQRVVVSFIVFIVSWSSATLAQQRDLQQTLGHTVFDEQLASYRFERFTVESQTPERHWRVTLGIPRQAPPDQGYPAFWMLDGNAALMEFDAALLESIEDQSAPPVLVFLGYDNDLRIDRTRIQDYTYTALADDEGRGGGAKAFLAAIERHIRPAVERHVHTDPHRQTLWGHSLGGLFALYTLFTQPDAFSTYAAGSPSLWWGEGALLDALDSDSAAYTTSELRVLLSLGGGERERDTSHRDMSDPRVRAHLQRVSSVPPEAVEQLAERLDGFDGVTADYREFPGLSHGETFRASLMAALGDVTGMSPID
ncbi:MULTISPECIES: alpha/beta hydrolase-fold protein [unclassified Halomonas]|uniref:alpha/beta hydrolase n=1 Tax=unclassified Halomonas TaxID=2609666 RepID=UPI00207669AE|nr:MULTISPECIES: alpha/beta hydrolase-fold protein [unclassified Halomonas]